MVGLRKGDKAKKHNSQNLLVTSHSKGAHLAIPSDNTLHNPNLHNDQIVPQQHKTVRSIKFLRAFHPSKTTAWPWTKAPPPQPSESGRPVPGVGTFSDSQETVGEGCSPPAGKPLPGPPATSETLLAEAGVSSAGDPYPRYEDDKPQSKVSQNDPGRPQRFWQDSGSGLAPPFSNVVEVDGTSSPERQELSSVPLADPPQELAAPSSADFPAPLVPGGGTGWRPSVHGDASPNVSNAAAGTMPPSGLSVPANGPKPAQDPTTESSRAAQTGLAEAGAQAAFRKAIPGKRRGPGNFQTSHTETCATSQDQHAQRETRREPPPRRSSKDTVGRTKGPGNAPTQQAQAPSSGHTDPNRRDGSEAPSEPLLLNNVSGPGLLCQTLEDSTQLHEPEGPIEHYKTTPNGWKLAADPPGDVPVVSWKPAYAEDPEAGHSKHLGAKLRELEVKYEEQGDMVTSLQHQLNSVSVDNEELHREVSQARTNYDRQRSQVERLLRDMEDLRNRLRAKGGEVRDLSTWLANEKNRATQLEHERNYYHQQRNLAYEERDKLQGVSAQEREVLERSFQSEYSRLQTAHEAELQGTHAKYGDEVASLRGQLRSQEEVYNSQLRTQRDGYEEEMQAQVADHKRQLEEIERRIRAETDTKIARLEDTAGMLRTQLAEHSSSMKYKPLPDSHFKRSLGALAQRITSLAASVPRPSDYSSARPLDTTGFLSRHTQPRHWGQFVRHVTWQMMIQGFFVYPLGFGAFGNAGAGQEELYEFYRLFSHTTPDGGVQLPNDAETNAGRAWFFGGILRDIKAGEAGDCTDKYRRLYWANVRGMETRLLATLEHMSGSRLENKTKSLVADLVSDFGVLSLETGSQRSHIMLEQCAHGEVALSSKFKDDDGDPKAVKTGVDLMTQPCMIRIGDGQGDLYAQVVLVRGDVVGLEQGRNH